MLTGHAHAAHGADLRKLALGALGVVYGDIGTSPLYALKECVTAPHGVAATHDNILGLLSLVFWSITLVVSVKYLLFVMRADNDGEGGVLALMALVARPTAQGGGGESGAHETSTRTTWTGLRRSKMALVMLGHDDVKLYDASLSEWAVDPVLPMETGPMEAG